MSRNPSPDQMRDMIEAIFAKTDAFRASHQLDPLGDQTGFNELLRLVFSDDAVGASIFASFDEKLLSDLWDMYQKRVLAEMK